MKVTSLTNYNTLHDDFKICAKVLKVNYSIQPTGKVELKIRTDADSYIKIIEKELDTKIETEFTFESIAENDIVIIYLHNDPINGSTDKTIWLWTMAEKSESTKRYLINDTKSIHNCPVCGESLTVINNELYCINSNCVSKLIYSIRYFLQIATPFTWDYRELIVFNRLITINRLKDVSDIFTLTSKDTTAYVAFFNSFEYDVLHEILRKLGKIKNCVTVFGYLNSLNIPHTNTWYLNRKVLCTKKYTVLEIINMILNNDTQLLQLMNTETLETLRTYFANANNVEVVKKLQDIGVFVS